MRHLVYLSLAAACSLLWTGILAAAPLPEGTKKKLTPEQLAKCEKIVSDYAKNKAPGGFMQPLKDDNVASALPGFTTSTLLFRQFPVGRPPAAGFAVSNVLVCDADGKVQVLKSSKEVTDFFKTAAASAKTEAQMAAAAKAWIRLDSEMHQDGFYKFKLMDDATKVAGKAVDVTVVVMQGGSGTLAAKLEFDNSGKLTSAVEDSKLRPGPRPICQATKLLDADPIVRRIAEADLLIMGTAARPYLDEQRAKASPELQKAIDRLWQRIVATDR